MYEVFLTREAQDFYEQADPDLARKINRLKGPLAGPFRYRVGDWRVIYQVDEQEHELTVLLIAHRSKDYQ